MLGDLIMSEVFFGGALIELLIKKKSFFEGRLKEMKTKANRGAIINHFVFRMKIIFDIQKEMTVIH